MASIVSLIQMNPKLAIIILAVIVSFFISLVNYFFMDRDRIKEIKEKQKRLNAEAKQHRKDGNQEKAMALQQEALKEAPEMLKHTMKPMLITIIPILIFFSLIRNTFSETSLASSWLWWYIGASFAASMVFRKLFKLP